MPKFSSTSTKRLLTCHPDLIKLFQEVVRAVDCTVVCGERGKKEQEAAYESGNSRARWPMSCHNRQPSLAVDVIPYPVNWSAVPRFYYLAGYTKRVAEEMGLVVTWGGEWSRYFDGAHYQLEEKHE